MTIYRNWLQYCIKYSVIYYFKFNISCFKNLDYFRCQYSGEPLVKVGSVIIPHPMSHNRVPTSRHLSLTRNPRMFVQICFWQTNFAINMRTRASKIQHTQLFSSRGLGEVLCAAFLWSEVKLAALKWWSIPDMFGNMAASLTFPQHEVTFAHLCRNIQNPKKWSEQSLVYNALQRILFPF